MRSGRRSSKGLAGRDRRNHAKDSATDKDKEHLEKTLKKMRRGEEESEEVVGQTKTKTKKRR